MLERVEIRSLTGLRAVAALCVFMFHMQIHWPFSYSPFFGRLIGQGAVGMSIFFMLSGFVLTYQYAGQAVSYREYLVNRFARIYPIYALAAIIALPWIGFGLSSEHGRKFAQIALLVLTNVFAIQAWFPQLFSFWNDGGSWSISVEVFCYLLLPLMLPSIVRLGGRGLAILAVIAYIFALLPGMTYLAFDDSPAIFYSMPIFRLPEFVLGVCMCVAVTRHRFSFTGPVAAILLACTVAYLGTVVDSRPIYITHDWILLPTIASTIVFLATTKGYLVRMFGSALVTWLGKISYCFYSIQVLAVIALYHHHDALVKLFPALNNNILLLLSVLASLITLSAAAHRLVEEPSRRWIKHTRRLRQASSPQGSPIA